MPEPLTIGGREFVWRARTYIVGILNLSPDSFAGDGLSDVDAAVERALAMCRAGADLIDVGGESTRPGFEPIPLEVELARVCPVIEALLANRVAAPLSIDTTKPEVAEAALAAGAAALNDIHGLRGDPRLAEVAARYGATVIAMHNQRGRPPAADPVAALLDGFARLAQLRPRRRHPRPAPHLRPRLRLRLGRSNRTTKSCAACPNCAPPADHCRSPLPQAHDRPTVRLVRPGASGRHRRCNRHRRGQRRRPGPRPRCPRNEPRRQTQRRRDP